MFRVNVIDGETCDKCSKRGGTQDDPLLSISDKRRNEYNVIFVHERCLTRALDKAKQAAKRDVPST